MSDEPDETLASASLLPIRSEMNENTPAWDVRGKSTETIIDTAKASLIP
jgi:hypothetical protein